MMFFFKATTNFNLHKNFMQNKALPIFLTALALFGHTLTVCVFKGICFKDQILMKTTKEFAFSHEKT